MLIVLSASQTGTAEGFSKRVVAHSEWQFGISAAHTSVSGICDIESFGKTVKHVIRSSGKNVSEVSKAVILFVISTYGIGGPTSDGADFYSFLQKMEKQGEDVLRDLEDSLKISFEFAVLALGDSCYKDFGAMGKYTNSVLCSQGKRASLVDVTILDENIGRQKREDVFLEWRKNFFSVVASPSLQIEQSEIKQPKIPEVFSSDIKGSPFEKYIFSKGFQSSTLSDFNLLYDPENPGNVEEESDRGMPVAEITLAFETEQDFHAAGTIALLPKNSKEISLRVCSHLGLNPSDTCLMESKYELTHLEFFQSLVDLNTEPNVDLIEILGNFCSGFDFDFSGGKKPRTVGDTLLSMKNPVLNDLNVIYHILPRLHAREYTIASSPLTSKTEIKLCIKLADQGLTSQYLLDLNKDLETTSKLLYYKLSESVFKTAADMLEKRKNNVRLLFATNGTGIAATKSLLDHAECLNFDLSRFNVYAGFRTKSQILYSKDLDKLDQVQIGLSSESRRNYTQNMMLSQKLKIIPFLKKGLDEDEQEGLYVVVCGSTGLISGVKSSLKQITTSIKIRKTHPAATQLEERGNFLFESFGNR